MKYDVVIVGGGPAGSTAAKFLSEKEISVLIIEKDKLPRNKPCGGGLTRRVLDNYSYVNDKSMIECYTYTNITHSPSLKNKIEVEDKKPLIGMVLREKFDYGLVRLAIEKGAEILDGVKVVDIKIEDEKVLTYLDNGNKIESKIIIGADGFRSIVAKKTGLKTKPNDYAVCVLKEIYLDEKTLDKYFTKSRESHIYTRVQDIRGYGWVFPKKNHVNIGIGEFIFQDDNKSKTNLIIIFKKFIELLKEEKIIPSNVEINKFEGGAEPINTLNKTYSNRVVLIGDAAGFVCPTSGEGIYFSMRSGEIAAEIIKKAIDKKDFSENSLSIYQKKWKKDFGKELKLLYKLRKKNQKGINEKIFKIANFDNKLGKMIIHLGIGTYSYPSYKWKVLKQYFKSYIKYKLKRKN